MKTTIEKQPENIVKVDIEVPAKDAVNYYNNAAKRLAQYVNIPGFRKGKAPRNIVEQNIGEERIKHEALEGALPKIFSEVQITGNRDALFLCFFTSLLTDSHHIVRQSRVNTCPMEPVHAIKQRIPIKICWLSQSNR